ncbi:MAG: hypothetical protein CMJ34_09690 [Phycisphaerae bacterium]|nr:hypothetical protein [Phycisphaerae bacterium]
MNAFIRWWLGLQDLPVGSEGLRLVWERPFAGWVWLVVLLACGGIAAWSYSSLDANRRLRWGLASMRALLLLILFICVSGPMLELPRERVEPDWVAVLVDRSRSMQVRDGEGESSGERSRREEILRETLSSAGPEWRRPGETRRILWLGFDEGVTELETITTDEDDAGSPVIVDEPDGWRTRIGNALDESLRRTMGRPLAGIVVLSDGRTEEPPDRELVRRLIGAAAPVQVVPLGASTPVGDAAIGSIEAPRRAFSRDAVPVVVRLDNRGRSESVRVELVDEETGSVLDTTDIELDGRSDQVDAVLTARPDASGGVLEGSRRWTIRISGDDDLVPENDIASVQIDLVDRPLRVLYVEGGPRWEYRYLKNLLVREPSIESSVMLLSADRDFAQEGNTPLARLPRDATEFGRFDLIILGDVPSSFLTEGRQEAIREVVERRGGGLIMLGGTRSMPGTWEESVLADLIPFSGGFDLDRRSEPVMANPTETASRLGVMRLSDVGEDTDDGFEGWPLDLSDPSFGWSRLQWVQRIDPERLKPTAEVLATAVPVDGDVRDETPLVITMRFGAGQVLYVATDEIWRWRYGRGEQLYERFWVQLLRLLGREAIESDLPIRMTVGPDRVEMGRPVLVTVDLLDASLGITAPETVLVEATDEDGVIVRTIELSASGESSWTGSWIPDRLGSVEHRIAEWSLASMAGDQSSTVEVVRPDDELRMADADHGLLTTIAAETGGSVHDIRRPDDPRPVFDRIHEVLPNRAVITEIPLRERIWTSPLFLLVILILATLEWSGRRLGRLD